MGKVSIDEPGHVPSVAVNRQVTVETERQGGVLVLVVSGEIDLVSEPQLTKDIDTALLEESDVLVVDLSGVSFIASVGLATLVRAQQRADEHDIALRVVASQRAVLRPLEVTGLDKVLAVYASRAAALQEPPVTDRDSDA